jgi:predicted GH43/DUF377 family glycosyl hydrolase
MNRWLLLCVGVLVIVLAGCGGGSGDPVCIPPATSGGDLDITPHTLPVAMPEALYSQVLSTTGGTTPYAWDITSGSPPGTVSIDPGTGELSGTPDAPGTFTFMVTVTDASSPVLSGFRTYHMKVTDGADGWGRPAPDAVLAEGTGWEAGAVGMPCVIKEAPDSYKMWYSAADTVPADYDALLAADVAIGLATSTDGISWSKHGGNPVLTKTGNDADPDGAFVGSACVVKIGSTYHMWYSGAKSESFMTFNYVLPNICYATSADGVAWTRQGAAIQGSIDIQIVTLDPLSVNVSASLYSAPWVIYDSDDSLYKMWFTFMSFSGVMSDPSDFDNIFANVTSTIGYATSSDGTTWDIQNTNVLSGSASWEGDGVSACCVIKDSDEGFFKMFYTGSSSSGTNAIGFAKSGNGISWTKSSSNPVFEPADTGWDSASVATPCAIKDLSIPCYKMWYTGADTGGGFLGRIGYAECPYYP